MQLALTSELQHRRQLESELDQLRRQVIEHEREVAQARAYRERADEDIRQAQLKAREEYSSGQSRLGDTEDKLRRAKQDVEEIRMKYDYLDRDYTQCKQDLGAEQQRNVEHQREIMNSNDIKKKLELQLIDLS